MSESQAEIFAEYLETIPPELREAETLAALQDLLPGVETLGQAEARLQHDWSWWGRPEQIWRPGPETYTLALAGRGWGKSAAGAHAALYVMQHPELCGGRVAEGEDDEAAGEGAVMAIAGRTTNDVNQTMIEEGIMAYCDPALRPEWRKSDRLLVSSCGVRWTRSRACRRRTRWRSSRTTTRSTASSRASCAS